MTEGRYYTTQELIEAAGVTFRQADHWTQHGILQAAPGIGGPGSRRHYPETEVIIARVIGRLSQGLGLQGGIRDRLRDLAHELRTDTTAHKHTFGPGIELDLDVLAADD